MEFHVEVPDYANSMMKREALKKQQFQNKMMQRQDEEATAQKHMGIMYKAAKAVYDNPVIAPELDERLKQQGIIDPGFQRDYNDLEKIRSDAVQDMRELEPFLSEQQNPNRMGTYNPRDYTSKSWAEFSKSRDPSVLKRYESPVIKNVGGVPSMVGRTGSNMGQVDPLSSLQSEAAAKASVVDAQESAKLNKRLEVEPEIVRQKELKKAAAGKANKAFEQIDKIQANIGNLKDAIQAVRDGAGTGPLMSRLPSLRASSQRLDNIRNRLGLDVIGSVTFGALSEGEMRLAMETALPTNMEGPELIEFVESKIAAQEKVMKALDEQAAFLSNGGTQAEWRAKVTGGAEQQDSNVVTFDPVTGRFSDE